MGIDTHSLNFLRYAYKKYGGFGRTMTLGRQAVHLGPGAVKVWLGPDAEYGDYCESMLTGHFGSTHVDSIDNSSYEGATIVVDMNHPLPPALEEMYDTVIDLGCSEHIFNIYQCMQNIASMCKPGGIVLQLLPASGFCGHGFYQFSPEFFFSCYSKQNGFDETEVFLADLFDLTHIYRVNPPNDAQRINIRTSSPVYVVALTRRIQACSFSVQQSDYVQAWDSKNTPLPMRRQRFYRARLREMMSSWRMSNRLLHFIDAIYSPQPLSTLNGHPQLKKLRVSTLCG